MIVCMRFSACSNAIFVSELEHLLGDLHGGDAELLVNIAPHLRLEIVERGETMHELGARIAGGLHQVGVDLIWLEQLDPFRPDLLRLPHRHPDVGVDKVDAGHGVFGTIRNRQLGAVFCFKTAGDLDIGIRRPQGLRPADADIHAEEASHDHQGMPHIRSCIADVGVFVFRAAACPNTRAWS